MDIHKLLSAIKEKMSEQSIIRIGEEIYKIQYRTISTFAGLVAFGLIVNGSIRYYDHPIIGVLEISYAFGVMLPLSYYQMKKSEETNEK